MPLGSLLSHLCDVTRQSSAGTDPHGAGTTTPATTADNACRYSRLSEKEIEANVRVVAANYKLFFEKDFSISKGDLVSNVRTKNGTVLSAEGKVEFVNNAVDIQELHHVEAFVEETR